MNENIVKLKQELKTEFEKIFGITIIKSEHFKVAVDTDENVSKFSIVLSEEPIRWYLTGEWDDFDEMYQCNLFLEVYDGGWVSVFHISKRVSKLTILDLVKKGLEVLNKTLNKE